MATEATMVIRQRSKGRTASWSNHRHSRGNLANTKSPVSSVSAITLPFIATFSADGSLPIGSLAPRTLVGMAVLTSSTCRPHPRRNEQHGRCRNDGCRLKPHGHRVPRWKRTGLVGPRGHHPTNAHPYYARMSRSQWKRDIVVGANRAAPSERPLAPGRSVIQRGGHRTDEGDEDAPRLRSSRRR